MYVTNTVEYEQHDATIVQTVVQYDTEADTKFAHTWDYDISSGPANLYEEPCTIRVERFEQYITKVDIRTT